LSKFEVIPIEFVHPRGRSIGLKLEGLPIDANLAILELIESTLKPPPPDVAPGSDVVGDDINV